jgi:hypothetical protein
MNIPYLETAACFYEYPVKEYNRIKERSLLHERKQAENTAKYRKYIRN